MEFNPQWFPIVYLTDCRDVNAEIRLSIRVGSHFFSVPEMVPVAHDVEAAGMLIDIMDEMSEAGGGVILANCAPRNGDDNWQGRQWDNGSPFGYFWFKNVLIACTIGGYILSLVKQLGLTTIVNVVDISEVLELELNLGEITPRQKEVIIQTQFRSLHFLPKLARLALYMGVENNNLLPHYEASLSSVPEIGNRVWFVDCFGNCKLTIPTSRYDFMEGEEVRICVPRHNGHIVPYHRHLKDVSAGQVALIEGSSGIGEHRFFELAQGGMGNAAKLFHLQSGDEIMINEGG